MKIRQFQVDAFTSALFKGNPAAVCPLESWLDDTLMQRIAAENNLSETAFFVPVDQGFELRWFTPAKEVDLCGHATLATAHVLFNHLNYPDSEIRFQTRSGELRVTKGDTGISMDLPAIRGKLCVTLEELTQALGKTPLSVMSASNYMVVYSSEDDIRQLQPDMAILGRLQLQGVIATAPGKEVDFVSRFFAPKAGIPEDPVTGSAHCMLTPYWANRLGKKRLLAKQLSLRSGDLICELNGDRVTLIGEAVTFLEGIINA